MTKRERILIFFAGVFFLVSCTVSTYYTTQFATDSTRDLAQRVCLWVQGANAVINDVHALQRDSRVATDRLLAQIVVKFPEIKPSVEDLKKFRTDFRALYLLPELKCSLRAEPSVPRVSQQ